MYATKSVVNAVGARNLAALLLSPQRSRPTVVVTVAYGQSAPWIDVEQIVDRAGDLVDVYVIKTMDASWEFAKHMPEGTQVYGGAGRVYSVGDTFINDRDESPLRLPLSARDGRAATDHLISDALSKAFSSGNFTAVSTPGTKPASGKVQGVVAGQVLVDLDGAAYGYIAPELTLAGFAADELFQEKQHVTGLLNPTSNRLDVTQALQSAAQALAKYEIGDVVLARVHDVAHHEASLMLYPRVVDKAVTVKVPRDLITGNPLDDLRDLMGIGDVVNARLIGSAPHWALVLTDIDDDELICEAPSLLPGGPPWLRPVQIEIAEPATASRPVPMSPPLAPENVPNEEEPPRQGRKLTQQLLLAIENKKAETAVLTDQVKSLGGHLEQAEYDRETLRTQLQDATREVNILNADLAKSRAQLRKAKSSSSPVRDTPVFADPEVGFRYLVLTQWAVRLPAGEQLAKPLSDFTIGSKFLKSLRELQGISNEKVADVVVEILTGIAPKADGRAVHPLRQGAGATTPPVVRSDGAVCWRASLQIGTASARRIHYWILPGGGVELSRVTVHDDFNP